MQYYKVLDKDRKPFHGGKGIWPEPGQWLRVEGVLAPCENGIHICRPDNLLSWIGPEIWTVEYRGEHISRSDKVVVREARLTQKITAWTEKMQLRFLCACAYHCLPVLEAHCSYEYRLRRALEGVRLFLQDKLTSKEMYRRGMDASNASIEIGTFEETDRNPSSLVAEVISRITANRDIARVWWTVCFLRIARGAQWKSTQNAWSDQVLNGQKEGEEYEYDWQTKLLFGLLKL
jgi:hypothetical protein